MTTHYLMLRAYGDCVISFHLLASVPASSDVRIVGTRIACEVADVLRFSRFPIDPVLDDVAAFFDLRRAAPLRAVADLLKVRSRLKALLRPGDRVLFEHADWRDRWILPGPLGTRALRPPRGESAYEDRAEVIRQAFAVVPALPAGANPRLPIRSLAVHPGARVREKRLPTALVAAIVAQARDRGIAVSLIDPDGGQSELASRVRHYVAAPSLREAIGVLKQADLYVGADSLFLHLAYHYGIPACVLVADGNVYFAPPGLPEQGRCFAFAEAVERLAQLLDARDAGAR